jgi:hypothetical protein
LHSGQSDWVRLGTLVAIGTLSQLLGSELGAHVGWGNSPFGRIALRVFEISHATFDTEWNTRAATADMVLNLQPEIRNEGKIAWNCKN